MSWLLKTSFVVKSDEVANGTSRGLERAVWGGIAKRVIWLRICGASFESGIFKDKQNTFLKHFPPFTANLTIIQLFQLTLSDESSKPRPQGSLGSCK